MPVSNPGKTIDKTKIPCGGSAKVTLSFDASPLLKNNPADITLIMDRSGSMDTTRMAFAKDAAKTLIDMVAAASGGTAGGNISGGSRMAVVSFSNTATVDVPLSQDVPSLKDAVDALSSGGLTNHVDAFTKAETLLDPASGSRQIVIMFTDGSTTVGGEPLSVTESIKATGAEIYCIGLLSDPAALNSWANTPSSTYVSFTNDAAKLDEVFKSVACEVVLAGALDVAIDEKLSKDFKITKVYSPSHGTAVIRGAHDILWQIDGMGSYDNEKASLSFDIMHTGTSGGDLKVNESVSYSDRAGEALIFPEPTLTVDCAGIVIAPESCPLPTTFGIEECKDAATVSIPETFLTSLGRIVRVDAVLKNICPGKKVAAAVFLTEIDENGVEHQRGMKTVTVPAQQGTECQDITLKCIHFVVPEETGDLCRIRGFKVRVMANYVDTDFTCCEDTVVTV